MEFMNYKFEFSDLRDRVRMWDAKSSGKWFDGWQDGFKFEGTFLEFTQLEMPNCRINFRLDRGDKYFMAEGYIRNNVFIPRPGSMTGDNLFKMPDYMWSMRSTVIGIRGHIGW